MIRLSFHAGTLEVRGLPESADTTSRGLSWDARSACHRAPAHLYAELVLRLLRDKVPYTDEARQYQELTPSLRVHRQPRPYQAEALAAWKSNGGRGVVVLPTGSGKTHVAMMAIADKWRSTLVVAPTLDLVHQWYELLKTTFALPVGLLGGGEYDIQSLTVTTYDSAYLHMEHLGARFGLVVYDECHHLPGPTYALSARFCLAPYRLGLTATPERTDGQETALGVLIGNMVYRKDIVELSGEYLADYETETVVVELSDEERAEYQSERALYRNFVLEQGIDFRSPSGFSEFMMLASRSERGQRALKAYRRQRQLAFTAPAKLDFVEELLFRHHRERCLLFTQDNATAYAIAQRFLLPVITHQTKVRERSEILKGLAEGTYVGVVTSKVLNEGVDIPSASVAIVISGSGSVREHVQRLGRILRKSGDKRAILYELVSGGTSETYTSERRREHVAYR